MHCPYKNSYLQTVTAVDPRVINKVVDRAMHRLHFDMHCEMPAAKRLESMQPSLYAPHVDYTRTRLGFGRRGLRLINRDLHSNDELIQLQALHTILDQVQISESALFLIDIQVIYRIMDIMIINEPVIREKACMILTHLAKYHQGRQRIMSRIQIIDNLLRLILSYPKEVRYAAALTLNTLARDRCACEFISKAEGIIQILLQRIKHDNKDIVVLHLQTLSNLAEWDPTKPLQEEAFELMMSLFPNTDPRISSLSMDVMAQLCKHEDGKTLADDNDIVFILRRYLESEEIEVIIAATGLLCYTTLTTQSKWRAKETSNYLTKRLVELAYGYNKPVLQLRCMQVLINLCDAPDIRYYMKHHYEYKIRNMPIRTHEQWDGTSETTSYGLETGTNYRTMCIEGVETIKNDWGDNALVVNVHSYLRTVRETRDRLLAAISYKCYK